MSSPSHPDPNALAQLRHDLRTPLNQIIGYSELLLEDAGEALHGDLHKIRQAAHNLVALIGQRLAESPSDKAPKFSDGNSRSFSTVRSAAGNSPRLPRSETPSLVKGRILIVDDEPANCDLVARYLQRQGHTVGVSNDGTSALQRLYAEPFDLVLLDLLMPGLDGYGTLREIKTSTQLRHLPVIMISALDGLESVVQCIESGAEDYLPKPFNPTLLRARIEASLEKKHFRDQEQLYLKTIERTQSRLKMELTDAENYIRSILPPPTTTPPAIDWRLLPSTELGGDSFGYHWVDSGHLALYLLDVCGHGVGAALLSVAAINVLRSASLPGVNFRDPGAVLTALNEAFPMEKQNNLYFTIWYGVWCVSEQKLRFASAGHPPALLAIPANEGHSIVELLKGSGPVLGALPGIRYETVHRIIPAQSRLYVVSDGTFEVTRTDGTLWPFRDYLAFFAEPLRPNESELDRLLSHVKTLHGGGPLDDDFSILRFQF